MPALAADVSPQTVSRREALTTWLIVAAVFLGVSLLSVPVPGVNEPHYLSKARSFAEPSWCQNDFFLQSVDAHAVFFAVVGPVTKWLSFSSTILVGRALSLMLLGWGWTTLGRQLGLSGTRIAISACTLCLVAMTGNFSGEWIIGGFESKVPAYGCAFVAVAWWLRAWQSPTKSQYALAAVMAGLAVSWHPVVGLWFCIGIAVTELLLVLQRGPHDDTLLQRCRALGLHGIVFVAVSFLFALPGLVPALKIALSTNVPVEQRDQANLIQVFWRLAHHLDPSSFPQRAWIHTGVLSALFCTGLVIRRIQHQRGQRAEKANWDTFASQRSTWWPMIGLLLASALTAAVGVVIGWYDGHPMEMPDWQLRAMLLKFYPFRFFDALLPVSVAFVLSTLRVKDVPSIVKKTAVGIFVVTTFAAAFWIRPSAPTAYSASTYAGWHEACRWLKLNSPENSVIYGPRESFGLKLFAERAEYVCFKDCPQDAAGILEWNSRLCIMHSWSENAYQDRLFDEADLTRLNQQTGITHILTRRLGPFAIEPVWQKGRWKIYETRGKLSATK